jgi:hypothetical protein
VATMGCDGHGIDVRPMALERHFGFPRRQVPDAQRVVVGTGDHAATIGRNGDSVHPKDVAFERARGFAATRRMSRRRLIHATVSRSQTCNVGVAEAVGEFGDLHRKLDEAYDKNDAAAVAALFTEDGLYVTPDEMFSGRLPHGRRPLGLEYGCIDAPRSAGVTRDRRALFDTIAGGPDSMP